MDLPLVQMADYLIGIVAASANAFKELPIILATCSAAGSSLQASVRVSFHSFYFITRE